MTITEQDIDRLVDAMAIRGGDPEFRYLPHKWQDDDYVRATPLRAALKSALARLNAPQPFVVWMAYNANGIRHAYTVDVLGGEETCEECAKDEVEREGGIAVRGRFVPDEEQP